tara:strand:+ start:1012 stop:1341 length:330 start_codon:yes stop_codon:yes gene_type:complete
MINQKTCVPCQGGIPPLNKKEINALINELDVDWQVYEDRELRKIYVFETYKKAILFVNRIADLAEEEGHHPYIHINFKKVEIILFTHKINGLHENDFILASKCDLIYCK